MRIEEKITLDESLIASVTELEAVIQEHDQTYRDIYLDSRFNFDQSMPAFQFAWQEDVLVGFLSIYADNSEEAELSVIVHPEYRRQGIAKVLIENAKSIVQAYDIDNIVYISERRFIEETAYLQDAYQINWDETEYIMQADERLDKSFVEGQISVREAVMNDAHNIASFQSEAFDSSFKEAMTYAEGSIGDAEHAIYVFLNEDEKIVGSSSVNITDDYYYLFGLAVDTKYQGQGVGTQGIYIMMKQLSKQSKRPFRLSVEKENEHAKYLYQKNGFEVISEVIYLSE